MTQTCCVCGTTEGVMMSMCDRCTHSWYVSRGQKCPLNCCIACDEIKAKHGECTV